MPFEVMTIILPLVRFGDFILGGGSDDYAMGRIQNM